VGLLSLLHLFVLMALFVYAAAFVFRNWPLSRLVLPYGVRWAVVATALALPAFAYIMLRAPGDRGGPVLMLLVIELVSRILVVTAGTLLWLRLGYRPYPHVWGLGPLPSEETIWPGPYATERQRIDTGGLVLLCAACVAITIGLYHVSGARPSPQLRVAVNHLMSSPDGADRSDAPPAAPARAGNNWPVPRWIIALELVAGAFQAELVCRVMLLALLLGLCRRWQISPHLAVVTTAMWWALGNWGASLTPGWLDAVHTFCIGMLMGYLMPLAGLEICLLIHACVALCSPLLWYPWP